MGTYSALRLHQTTNRRARRVVFPFDQSIDTTLLMFPPIRRIAILNDRILAFGILYLSFSVASISHPLGRRTWRTPYPTLHTCTGPSIVPSTCIHTFYYKSMRYMGRHYLKVRRSIGEATGHSPKKRFSFPFPLDDNLVITLSHPLGPACVTLTR